MDICASDDLFKLIKTQDDLWKMFSMFKHCDVSECIIIDYGDPTNNEVKFEIFTAINKYTIRAKFPTQKEPGSDIWTQGYLGAGASKRAPLPGENWTRGNDLSDGPCMLDTWVAILSDIVSYELLTIPTSKAKVAIEETAVLEKRSYPAGTALQSGNAKFVCMSDCDIGMRPELWDANVLAEPMALKWYNAPVHHAAKDPMRRTDFEIDGFVVSVFCDRAVESVVSQMIVQPPLHREESDEECADNTDS